MVFVWYMFLCPMVEFNLQNCISFKVVQKWDCDGIPILHSIIFHGLLLPSSQQIFLQLLIALILSYSSKTVQVQYFF